MSEMVERVARAMFEDDEPPSDHWSPQWDGLREKYVDGMPSHCKEYWRRKARVAIEAIREPTAKMVEAGEKHMDSCWTWNPDGGSSYNDPEGTFSAMIDEALK